MSRRFALRRPCAWNTEETTQLAGSPNRCECLRKVDGPIALLDTLVYLAELVIPFVGQALSIAQQPTLCIPRLPQYARVAGAGDRALAVVDHLLRSVASMYPEILFVGVFLEVLGGWHGAYRPVGRPPSQ